MKAIDIILNTNDYNLGITNGDFIIGESDQQHIQTILHAKAGQFYETPMIGVGIIDHLNSGVTVTRIKNVITKHLNVDNFDVKSISVGDDFTIGVDAIRKG
tara:strand:+ start:53 stop:355 length:303 start_codon:yes stop_codon:yes gene_type:complete